MRSSASARAINGFPRRSATPYSVTTYPTKVPGVVITASSSFGTMREYLPPPAVDGRATIERPPGASVAPYDQRDLERRPALRGMALKNDRQASELKKIALVFCHNLRSLLGNDDHTADRGPCNSVHKQIRMDCEYADLAIIF